MYVPGQRVGDVTEQPISLPCFGAWRSKIRQKSVLSGKEQFAPPTLAATLKVNEIAISNTIARCFWITGTALALVLLQVTCPARIKGDSEATGGDI